jgi:kanamycin kinase
VSEPPPDIAVPAAVRRIAGPDHLRPVWRNELGGLTFELTGRRPRRFIKWAPAGATLDLAGEEQRLAWAARYTPVPRVIERDADDDGQWLITAALPGENAVTARWRAEPRTAVAAIGGGLRALHDALPVAKCPFSWSIEQRLAHVPAPARAQLPAAPPIDRLVVCHGDACAPNTLLTEDGEWSGHVDLDTLGVADRWADLAVAGWSTGCNYGPGWERALLDAYGIDPDPERSEYYRLLWAAAP